MNRRRLLSACTGFILGLQFDLGIKVEPVRRLSGIAFYLDQWEKGNAVKVGNRLGKTEFSMKLDELFHQYFINEDNH